MDGRLDGRASLPLPEKATRGRMSAARQFVGKSMLLPGEGTAP